MSRCGDLSDGSSAVADSEFRTEVFGGLEGSMGNIFGSAFSGVTILHCIGR